MLLYLVLGVLGAMLVVMAAAWAYGLAVNNGGWTDVFWSFGSGATLAAAAIWPDDGITIRQMLVAAMVAVWALRLGLYIGPRVASHGEDPRYARFRDDWGRNYPLRMLFVTLPQAPATALLAVTVVVTPVTGPAACSRRIGRRNA